MNRRLTILIFAAAFLLTACGGIPLRAIPRLLQFSSDMLEANPAEFRVALQVDARISPPASTVPMLKIQLTPKTLGAFEPVDKSLPLQLATTSGAVIGLDPAPRGRRWLYYSLPPETQAELRGIQATVRRAQAQPGYQKGGQLSLGIEQTDLALTDPALANTRWETWLQTKQSEGFFMVWTGTPAQILRQAKAAR
ncbi:MAG: hypothetical protein WEK74_14505 [Hydrogenophaga sp.]